MRQSVRIISLLGHVFRDEIIFFAYGVACDVEGSTILKGLY